MLHNPPYAMDKIVVEERKFQDILKETYSRLDGLELRLRESIAETITKFCNDPTDVISWRAESVIEDQTSLSIITEIRILINTSATLEDVVTNLVAFQQRYRDHVISWAHQGETSSSSASNLASRSTLAATAKVFGNWGFANEIERAIAGDIEETKKRVVVQEFVDLKVDEVFRLSPDMSTMPFRKLSPRKAIECVYPTTQANKRTIETHTKVYLWRIPAETDVLYCKDTIAA